MVLRSGHRHHAQLFGSDIARRCYWAAGKRIFAGTIDARLIALDARTGKKAANFGKGGEIDLRDGIRIRDDGQYQVTSPPAIVNDVVIVGSAVGDNRATDIERGTVRAFDARSGKLRWLWDPLTGLGATGAANAWGVMSADSKLGLVFIPTGSAAPDFYGGERKGDNRHANSVTALRAATGKVVWSFQVVHHDLWDYDVASQPVLIDFGPARTPAVVVTTKMGFVYVLDRKTGKPLSPVEERRVPESDVEGEEASPAQPFPVTLEPLVPTVFKPFGVTDADRKWCAEQVSGLRSEGIFTPPGLQGTIAFPGNVGGVAWGGPAYDPVRGSANRQHESSGLRDSAHPAGPGQCRAKKHRRESFIVRIRETTRHAIRHGASAPDHSWKTALQ